MAYYSSNVSSPISGSTFSRSSSGRNFLHKNQNNNLNNLNKDEIIVNNLQKQPSRAQSSRSKTLYTNLITCSGIMANVSASAQRPHRAIPPTMRGVYAAIKELLKHKGLGQLRIEYTDLQNNQKTIEGNFVLVAITLGPNVSPEINLMPKAKIGDDILHVFLLRKGYRIQTILGFIKATMGIHLNNTIEGDHDQNTVSIKAKKLKVTTMNEKKTNVCIDGEIESMVGRYSYEMGVSERGVLFVG